MREDSFAAESVPVLRLDTSLSTSSRKTTHGLSLASEKSLAMFDADSLGLRLGPKAFFADLHFALLVRVVLRATYLNVIINLALSRRNLDYASRNAQPFLGSQGA